MVNKRKWPLVSVVVPVYGTEKYVEKCLDSILNQTYQNIEVLVVNDASPDHAMEIVRNYEKIDGRVRLIENKENMGLFRTRLAGAKQASGKYITFVDSDDYLGIDYIRLLTVKAEEEQADIVKGQFVMDDLVNQEKFTYTYINNRPQQTLYGDEIAKQYFEQEGLDFSWHVVCAKLYNMQLWRQCEHYYEEIRTHLIMTEDIAFSAPLFIFAQKYTETDADTYFYVQRKDSSTSIEKQLKKFEKNISDLKTSFDFRDAFLKKTGNFEKYEKKNLAWKRGYGRSWKNAIQWAGFSLSQRKYLEKLVKEALCIDTLETITREDNYFYSMKNPWSPQEEEVKGTIADPKIICVSFDIFDTLIMRPFFQPSDLFRILDYKYKELDRYAMLDFSKARVEAEHNARKQIETSGAEEVTLEDIYSHLRSDFGIDIGILNKLKTYETELELQFCYRREFGYSLYELALFLGKKVILASDMYLDKEIVIRILNKNGYGDYEKLFLSSDIQKAKSTGTMYRHILKYYPGKGKMLHIGDNYESDYQMSAKFGIRSILLPKAVSVFRGEYADRGYASGNSYYHMLRPFGSFFDHKISIEFWGIRCMLAVAANKFFDNPYKNFHEGTDFNADIYYISYYALGMHLLGIVLDLCKKYKNDITRTIHFVARDGYGCKLVYDVLKKYDPKLPKGDYLYLSRKALLPLAFCRPSDVYCIKDYISYDSVVQKTPGIILAQFLGIKANGGLEEYLKQNGYEMDHYFKNFESFCIFLKILAAKEDLLEEKESDRDCMKKQFDQRIGKNDVLFDIGYNGTAQRILSNLLGRPVEGYYVYINKDRPLVNETEAGCKVETFYDRTPCISGAIREAVFSKGEPSCCGYCIQDGALQPVFEEDRRNYIEVLLNRIISQGIFDFANDFCDKFGDYLSMVTFRSYDISIPFEFFMERASDMDKNIFGCSYFEDDIFFGDGKIELASWWKAYSMRQECRAVAGQAQIFEEEIAVPKEYCLHSCRRWQRALVLLCINPRALVSKAKNYLKQAGKRQESS